MKVNIKTVVRIARACGYKVPGGHNGGGWKRLAAACGGLGVPSHKQFLKDLFRDQLAGAPANPSAIARQRMEARKPGPVTVTINPASGAFLRSYEWRKLRVKVLRKYGARCQCCGATAATGAQINVDHIKPRKHYPELALDENNLQVLCGACNHGKGNWDTTDWRGEYSDQAIGARLREMIL